MTEFESEVVARKRNLWQESAVVESFVEQTEAAHGPQRLKNIIETDIVRRFMRGEELLDVGIGAGRVSLSLVQNGLRLTGLDASAAMIERCGRDVRAAGVRLVHGDLEQLPFGKQTFDTVISVDTFAHFPDCFGNLDELLRVTRDGGRIIVDVGSRDHVDSVARRRGCASDSVRAAEMGSADSFVLRMSHLDLLSYAAERDISLVALIPYGAVLGSLVPNYWIADSYAARSGGIDRLISWIGADPLLFAAASFIERRVVQYSAPSISGRMFAVFERRRNGSAYREPPFRGIAACDDRGPAAWHGELDTLVAHEPNRTFVVALILAAWPLRLAAPGRNELPESILRELERTENLQRIDDICLEVDVAWRVAAKQLTYHGVDVLAAFAGPLEREIRDRLEMAQ